MAPKGKTGDRSSVGTEVANEKHVYEALKYGIDMLWIGARTSVNPITVQEIANALRGVDVMVFVKNPVNPGYRIMDWRTGKNSQCRNKKTRGNSSRILNL